MAANLSLTSCLTAESFFFCVITAWQAPALALARQCLAIIWARASAGVSFGGGGGGSGGLVGGDLGVRFLGVFSGGSGAT